MSPVIPIYQRQNSGQHGFERRDPVMDEKGLSKQVSGACDQFLPAPRIEHLVSASATRRKFDSGPLKVRFHLGWSEP